MAEGADKRQDVNAYQRDYMASRRASGRDIKNISPVFDPPRRRACSESFAEFCHTYFPEQFTMPWSPQHFRAAEKIERASISGGFFAFAMPRGSGKTTICRWGILWAILNGISDYVVLVGASERAAEGQLRNIRTMLCRNPLLSRDYPEAAEPIQQIMYQAVLPKKQTYQGNLTYVDWQVNRLVFPWIPLERELNTASRGAVIQVMGITSEIRGLSHIKPDNTSIRPSIALCDDPQTRESARSLTQSKTRLDTMCGDIAYLAGPGKPIAVVCPGTVIAEDDLIEQLLNRDLHPEWQGERTPMVESFPTNMDLWDEYADIQRASLKDDGDGSQATEFYRKNFDAMNAGSAVSWPERFRDDELSGIQHAMNHKIRDEAAFYAEYQNEPIVAKNDFDLLPEDEICRKTTNHARGVVPGDCSVVTAFTDVQGEHLFWMVCAWAPDFTGYILDYGAWPEQKANYFTRKGIRKTLSSQYNGDESGIMFAALTDLGEKLAGTAYYTGDGRELRLSRWCIDGNWRARTAAVECYAKQSKYANILTLTQGRGVKATENPFSQAQRALEWKTHMLDWFWQNKPGPSRWITFDANAWKKRVHAALSLSVGSRGSVQLFKAPPVSHRMLADHLRAEKPTKVQARGRTVYEWSEIPGRDNEGLDCLVGNFVAASMCGITRAGERIVVNRPKKKSKKVTYL